MRKIASGIGIACVAAGAALVTLTIQANAEEGYSSMELQAAKDVLEAGLKNTYDISGLDLQPGAQININIDDLTNSLLESQERSRLYLEQQQKFVDEAGGIIERSQSPQMQSMVSETLALQESYQAQQMQQVMDDMDLTLDQVDEEFAQGLTIPKNEVVVFLTFSMSDTEINAVMEEASVMLSHGVAVRVAFRGILDEEPSIYPVIARLAAMANQFKPVPLVQIDPEVFEHANVTVAPAVALFDETGKMTGRAVGYTSPRYLLQNVVDDRKNRPEFTGIRDFSDATLALEIQEPSIVDRIISEYADFDWAGQKTRAVDNYWRKYAYIDLPTVKETGTYQLDPTIIIEEDMENPFTGELIQRAGTLINPLHVQKYTKAMFVFDGTDPDQVKLALKERAKYREQYPSREFKLITTRLDVEQGNGWEHLQSLIDETHQHIYVLSPEIVEVWQLQAVPSLITADADYFYVKEFALNESID